MKKKFLDAIILVLSFIQGVILMQIAFCFLHEFFRFELGTGALRMLGVRVSQENLALFVAASIIRIVKK